MKKIITMASMVLCYALCLATGAGEPEAVDEKPNQPAYLKPISPDKLEEDLDFLFKTIEEVHPNMYAYTSKEEFEPARKKFYKQINRPMTRIEFFKLTAPVIAQLKNGHLLIDFPDKEFKDYVNDGGKVCPFKLLWNGRNATLFQDRSENPLPIGSIVLSVNGEDPCKLISQFAKYRANEQVSHDMFIGGALLHRYFWLEYGPIESWNVEIEGVNGAPQNFAVKAIPWKQYLANNPGKQNYSYRFISEYNTGIIEFNSCTNFPKFQEFLEKTFKQIHQQKVSNLIIDIRNNGGGTSDLGERLLDYITDKTYRQTERVCMKISKQFSGDDLEEVRKQFPNQKIEAGHVITDEILWTKPSTNPLRFNGNCYLLIGKATFSSASLLASAIKCYRIATVIGEETNGTTVAYGGAKSFTMPNSSLQFIAPSKYIVQACGKPDGRGVLPDYEVKQRPEDTAKDIDTVMEFTLNLIKSSEAKE